VVEALLTEVLVVLDAARFLIDNAFAILREEKLPHGNPVMKTKSGRILHEPYGVIGIISPWNYPFSIPATETLAALVAGNAVVLKPSELTPLIALELQALLREAGVPDDIFQVLPGEGATGAALVGSEIDKLVFTGSVGQAGELRKSPPNACFRWCWNWAAKIPCWCSKTPTSMSRRAAPSGERS
jgi:acyl-CoA reductase-like NAD-dependent aldehyde dehydrogenase